MNDERCLHLSKHIGEKAASELYFRFIQAYSISVARLDPDVFDHIIDANGNSVTAALAAYKDEMGENFPQSIEINYQKFFDRWLGHGKELLRGS